MNPLASTKCAARLLMALAAVSGLFLTAGCGSSSSKTATNPQGFSVASLNGTYVISISGTNVDGSGNVDPFAIAGTITADGNGHIKGGTLDINDPYNTGVYTGANAVSVSPGTYTVGEDGRPTTPVTIATSAVTFHIDFVLTSASHGLITVFDTGATASGTMDLQTAVTSLTGSYAFSLSGVDSSANPLGTVGAFTISSSNIAGTEDFNDDATSGTGYTGLSLTGQLALDTSGAFWDAQLNTPVPITSLTSLGFDVWVIDSTHLKFIEDDATGNILAGDAFTQVTSISAGQLVFTLGGIDGTGNPVVAGGYATTDTNGDLTNGFEDYNNTGSVGSGKPFSTTAATCVASTGRCQLTLNGFSNGTSSPPSTFVIYPSSGGGLTLEIDSNGAGLLQGASYTQSATSFSAAGYGLNLTGDNSNGEVDDIAEFAATTAAAPAINMTGNLDENNLETDQLTAALSGTYTPDAVTPADGRGSISVTTKGTFLGGLTLQYYVVNSSTAVFIEVDSGQLGVGTFEAQSPPTSQVAAGHNAMFMVRPLAHPHAAARKK
jgi:hypothetical protein